MKKLHAIVVLMCGLTPGVWGQQGPLPYAEIPEVPEAYSGGGVAARMVDGLGFRYYWATEGLRPEDLEFRPSPEGRSTGETVDHILGLSRVILNAALQQANTPQEPGELSFEEKRALTLNMLKQAADIYRNAEDLSAHTVVFENDANRSEFPFWNLVNGPIADALWHTGQVVTHRRTSGNPFPSGVSVFNGKKRD